MHHGEEECAWCGARRKMIALAWGCGVSWRYRHVVVGSWCPAQARIDKLPHERKEQ